MNTMFKNLWVLFPVVLGVGCNSLNNSTSEYYSIVGREINGKLHRSAIYVEVDKNNIDLADKVTNLVFSQMDEFTENPIEFGQNWEVIPEVRGIKIENLPPINLSEDWKKLIETPVDISSEAHQIITSPTNSKAP